MWVVDMILALVDVLTTAKSGKDFLIIVGIALVILLICLAVF